MYCPKCLNDTLSLASHGVVNVIINGKQMDAGKFLFNRRNEQAIKDLGSKLEEFFKWYSNFQNQDPIKYVDISSADFRCEHGCHLDLNSRFSVIGLLIPRDKLKKKLIELSKRYNMTLELKSDM